MPALRSLSVAAALAACLARALTAQPATPLADAQNFGFETSSIVDPKVPRAWFGGGVGYEIALDSMAPHDGRSSLRIRATVAPAPNAFGVVSSSLALGRDVAGHTVRLRGWVRTEDVRTGYAGLWMRADAGERMLTLDNMSDRGLTGTAPWTPLEIVMRVDTSATRVFFGALHPGDGTAWFDALTLDVDGVPYTGGASTAHALSSAETAWLRAHAHALTGADPNAEASDLRPIGDVVGDARIVALGEGTHGTSEFFRMKHRLTRYLAMEKGFTLFAIEANMPEARRVNEYVLTGRGDPKAALAGLYFWTWNTQEVLDLIEWMRAYNASGKHIEFWGFDLQTPNVAMDSVRAFVARADGAYAPTLDSAYAAVAAVVAQRRGGPLTPAAVDTWRTEAARVLAHLEQNRAAYAGRDTMEVAWAIQNARIVAQGAGSATGTLSRDSSMAANVAWIAAHTPRGTRMVLWAHNGHVNRYEGWMGSHLARRFGDSLRVIGFALGDGRYTAVGPRGLTAYPALAPVPGSVEASLHALGTPQLVLDMRRAASDRAGAWLAEPQPFRSIGAVALDGGFYPTPVARHYDALIYFDHTTPSLSLGYGARPAAPF